jgi:hypothetical protein
MLEAGQLALPRIIYQKRNFLQGHHGHDSLFFVIPTFKFESKRLYLGVILR